MRFHFKTLIIGFGLCISQAHAGEFAWDYNSWTKNALGCIKLPNEKQVSEHKDRLITFVTRNQPIKLKRLDEETLTQSAALVHAALAEAKIGIQYLNCQKPEYIKKYNAWVDFYSGEYQRVFNIAKERAEKIKRILIEFAAFNPDRDAVSNWQDAKSTTSEFIASFRKGSEPELRKIVYKVAGEDLRSKGDAMWPRPTPEKQLRSTDIGILFNRLGSYFPAEAYSIEEGRLIVPEVVEVPQGVSVEDTCAALMQLSLSSMDDLLNELETIKGKGATEEQGEGDAAQYLSRQDQYVYRDFFFLAKAYRYIATLREDIPKVKHHKNGKSIPENWRELFFETGTKQSQWRQQYNERSKRFSELFPISIQLMREDMENTAQHQSPRLERARRVDSRMIIWFQPDNWPDISRRPTTEPT